MDPLMATMIMFGGNFAPRGWAFCSGQVMSISANTALYSLLGTTYGGDGRTTFALPDLRGRVPIHPGSGPGLSTYTLGEKGGTESVTLNVNQIPSHTHNVAPYAFNGGGDETNPGAKFPATATEDLYSESHNTNMGASPSQATGGSQPHTNIQPFLCVNFIMAVVGVYPSRS